MRAGELYALAERCETATARDRDVDREIWLAVVADYNQRELVSVGRSLHGDNEANFRIDRMADGRVFTASLDAAMTLVPWGWRAIIDMASEEGFALVDLWAGVTVSAKPKRCHSKAATPALALCAAALKASAASGTLTEGGDVEQAPSDSLSGPTGKAGDAQGPSA